MTVPTVRINVMPLFPAQVVGSTGIAVTRQNGVYTIGDNYESLGPISTIPNPAQAIFKTQNSVTGVYNAVPASALLAAAGVGPGGSTGQVQANNGSGGFAGLSNAQLTNLMNVFTSTTSGDAPASGGGTLNFLRADGVWAAPPGGGGGTSTFSTTVVATGASYSVTSTDDCVIVQKTTGSATTINLPSSTSRTRPIYIKDGKGDAGSNAITITPAGEIIDGLTTLPISTNYGSVMLTPNPAGGWAVLSYG